MAIYSYSTRTKFVEISKVVMSGILKFSDDDIHYGWCFEDNGKIYYLNNWMDKFDEYPPKRVRVTIELIDQSNDESLVEGVKPDDT